MPQAADQLRLPVESGSWAPPAQAWLLGICSSQHSFRSEKAQAPEVIREVTGGDVPSVGSGGPLSPGLSRPLLSPHFPG